MRRLLLSAMVLATLGACNRQPVECTAASAQSPVVAIVKEQLEKAVSQKVRDDDGTRKVSLAKIRAAIGQLVIDLADIRTSKEDPNSTKRFCTASLKVRFPADTLADADSTRSDANMNSVSDLADNNDIERNADSFSTAIDFNIQPTDDGSKVFAETESGNNMFGFASEVLASGLLRAALEEGRREQQKAVADQSAAQDAAITEQRAANLATVQAENALAVQAVAANWQSLSPEMRARLMPLQRAWIRKKDADCRVEAASASTEPTEREVARTTCDTRMTQERISWLQPYRAEPLQAPADNNPSQEELDADAL